VLGHQVQSGSQEPWAKVGYLVETPHAYFDLTVRENLEAARRLHPGTPETAVDDVIDRLSLGDYADRRTGTLSLGNAQRLGLAKALIHHPALLLLDEPANGLDPAGIVEIREMLRDLTQKQGVTVFMSSHILGEVSRLADRIGIIHKGKLIQELDKNEMEKARKRVLQVSVRNLAAGKEILSAAGYKPVITMDHGFELVELEAMDQPDRVATLLVNAGQPPIHLSVVEEDLEQYFLRLVESKAGIENG
jgi:ABC-2 type transport system ATP-binding protein